MVPCRALVDMGTPPQHVPSVAEQWDPPSPLVSKTRILAPPSRSAAAAPQPAAALPEELFPQAARPEQSASAPTAAGPSARAAPPAAPAWRSRPARLAAGARKAEARHASSGAARRGQARTARRSVGAQLQPAPEWPPVGAPAYDPSRLRTKMQVALRFKKPARSARSRELDTPSACTGLTEKSSVLGLTYIEWFDDITSTRFSEH